MISPSYVDIYNPRAEKTVQIDLLKFYKAVFLN